MAGRGQKLRRRSSEREQPVAVILIVEDEVFIRDLAELMVEEFGHTSLSASDMDEALVLLRSPQRIDALFTDIRLKTAVLGGYELAQLAIKLRPQLRVLYASGNSTTDKTKALFVRGARFLQKPYSPEGLKGAIEDLLAAPDDLARPIPSL